MKTSDKVHDKGEKIITMHPMFLTTINKLKQLLYVSFIDKVRVEEIAKERENAAALLADLRPGFRLLTDLERLESLAPGCEKEIGKLMELCDQKEIGLVVRVIPDPSKDIGLNILSRFHYHRPVRLVTCESMMEAAQLLSL